jgi:hypothetical protein
MELITLAIALYGAALATYSAVEARREKRRRLRVSVSNGFLSFDTYVSDVHVFVEAANPGLRPVTVVSMGIVLPDGEQVLFPAMPGAARLPTKSSKERAVRSGSPRAISPKRCLAPVTQVS